MTAFNAGALAPLGSVFIALSCFFLVLSWRRGFFFFLSDEKVVCHDVVIAVQNIA